jgi:succinate dehydrogenase (ubiquinone) iron-sulfur subunit
MLHKSLLAARQSSFMATQYHTVRRNLMLTTSTRVFGAKGAAIPEGF